MAERTPYRHIHVRGLGVASEAFRGPTGGGPEKNVLPVDNRAAHANKLMDGLEHAVALMDEYRSAQKKFGLPANKRGMPVTIESRHEIALRVGQGRSGQGFALLNVHRGQSVDPERGPEADHATFFTTPQTLATFRRDLQIYGAWVPSERDLMNSHDEDQEAPGRPRRFKLFESAAGIRPTTLLDLWTDRLDRYPRTRGIHAWEVWTRIDFQDAFERATKEFELRQYGRPSDFIDTVVRGLIATPAQIHEVVRATGAVVGLRSASTFASDDQHFQPEDMTETLKGVAARIQWPGKDAPVVAVLDTGVQARHPLLNGALPASHQYTAEPFWGTGDHDGHGTNMAGVVLYGDLASLAVGGPPIRLTTRLESVIVTAPEDAPPVPARDAIRRAVEEVEVERAIRVYCLAQTASGELEDGLPTSTSGVLDQLAYGDGIGTRLFCAAVGNVPHTKDEPYQAAYYAERNAQFGIQSPAQALNALSVGAVSLKDVRTPSKTPVADAGDLAPTSRTAQAWAKLHANKPDIVMEGGNFTVDADGVFCRPSPTHMVLTTSRPPPTSTLALAGETSAATAACAGLAGRLLARYPKLRMETVRALMVHAAEWTPAMRAQLTAARNSGVPKSEAYAMLIGRFGWGVPDETRLFESARNALTLMVEDTLQPYRRGDGSSLPLKEMKYFKLPWPEDALRALGGTQVEMRCTLSYFIEPDLHAVARDQMKRYPSHRLRFDVKRYGEDDAQARARVNTLADESDPVDDTNDDGWVLGSFHRHRGALHHDIWTGPAHQLVERGGISILPVRGWWGDTRRFNRDGRSVNFSLVVSIRTPESGGGDLFTEVVTKIKPANLVETPAAVIVT
ncbi:MULTISPECIES: S8 family peptidase [unclassified Methylobacterium]|uniref:S8 family peptidase n=1 Tax=unclassified Methylobacterium TaxID=2615210 RepID=UPI0011C1F472|nr:MULTISPECIES: S8 family peptidase [unclassified Methylobacterium]QEE39842.1 S8 family serine peptidase [Methylobacterium sp. WL1]TXN57314.1 S8 family serine peptidase [Methylobacterium sp. WL2]